MLYIFIDWMTVAIKRFSILLYIELFLDVEM